MTTNEDDTTNDELRKWPQGFRVPLDWCITHRAPGGEDIGYCGLWRQKECEMVALYRLNPNTLAVESEPK